MPTIIANAITPIKYIKEKSCTTNPQAGSRKQNEPRLVGEILHELINTSDEPLAKGYRKFIASKENVDKGGQSDE